MKKLIRELVFETNSSSCHSISLSNKTGQSFLLDTLYPDENGIITINGGQFGWEVAQYNDAYTKASYAATSTLYWLDSEVLIGVIKKQTAAKEVILNISEDYGSEFYSYIDHESTSTCPKNAEDLRDFIFNKNSWLYTDNDNH